jgi:Zn-dependent M32 family carboxypeptidase
VNRLSVGAILTDLKHRLSEIYDLNAARSMLTWDHATHMPKGGAASGVDSRRRYDALPTCVSLIQRSED